ncbi:MAG: glyoxalase, partial [Clostridia bacterium]|nr:glyoxalase [Clostridia bacterium]
QDLQAAKAFFLRYFLASAGAPYHNRQTGLHTCFLIFEGGARLELMTRPGLSAARSDLPQTGFSHLAISLGSREAVNALTETLQADGYNVLSGPRVTGDGYYESCVQGPEGCTLELTV